MQLSPDRRRIIDRALAVSIKHWDTTQAPQDLQQAAYVIRRSFLTNFFLHQASVHMVTDSNAVLAAGHPLCKRSALFFREAHSGSTRLRRPVHRPLTAPFLVLPERNLGGRSASQTVRFNGSKQFQTGFSSSQCVSGVAAFAMRTNMKT